jgi:hypothetical protein
VNGEKDIAVLAAAVHGALSFGHLLGAFYNLRNKRYWWAAFHAGAALADAYAVKEHVKDARKA